MSNQGWHVPWQRGMEEGEEPVSKPTISPGKRTLTMSLPAGAVAASAPVQMTIDPAAAHASRAEHAAITEQWMEAAVRPDLYRAPVQRKNADRAQESVLASPAGPVAADDGTADDGAVCEAPSVLQSSDPEVDGRPVSEVGADLRERARRYHELIPTMREGAESTKRMEEDWHEDLGLIGGLIDLFNDVEKTDPRRWDLVLVCWQTAERQFNEALVIQVSDETINTFGQRGEEAISSFEDAFQRTSRAREEYTRYLQGFQGSAQGVLTVTTIVRDVSFAAAVGIAVVVAAPVVFGATSTFATGTLGLSGTSATLFAGGTTALAMGGIGAGIEGGGQAAGALIVESSQLIADLMDENTTWEQAIDNFDWDMVAEQGWEGFKRGFVDGVLAYAGMGFERVLHSGAQVALNRVLGEAGGRMLAQILRRAMERAIAGGVSGGVIGALDAGIKTAMNGGSVGEVLQAVQDGFVLGAALGTALGAGSGALEGRGAARLTEQVDELQHLLRDDPEAFATRFNELMSTMTDEQRAAFRQELQGRRFVDAEHYGPAAEAYESGMSSMRPEHRYGQESFDDWSEAASFMDEHARSGEPLTVADVEAAHGRAARGLTDEAGRLRTVGTEDAPLLGAGGMGYRGAFSALSPEQIAILESNPHIRLRMRGMMDMALTPEQVAANFETAIISYPNADTVAAKMDDFFAWYGMNRGAGDPMAFAAEAQRRLVSIHPFADGNGRISRLVMDHALQSEGLPPALLRDPNIDYLVSPDAWAEEVRQGVMETYRTAARHAGLFDEAVRLGDVAAMAARWGAVLGLAGNSSEVIDRLYAGVCE